MAAHQYNEFAAGTILILTQLIFNVFMRWNWFLKFKEKVPFKIKKKSLAQCERKAF